MSSPVKYGAQRSLQSEILSLMAVMITPMLLALVFPYGAIGFESSGSEAELTPKASIVFLTLEEESDLIARSRNAWQRDENSLNIDMTIEWLPELDSKSVVDLPIIHVLDRQSKDMGKVSLIPPSLAAKPAKKIELRVRERTDVFEKDGLLKLK